jgi:hypothetical protein
LLSGFIFLAGNKNYIDKDIALGIGCSVFTSAFMAILIERIDYINNRAKLKIEKSRYHNDFYRELQYTLCKIICFYDVYKSNNIDEHKPIQHYLNPQFLISQNNPSRKVSYDELINILNSMKYEFSLDAYKKMSATDKKKTDMLFSIILYYCEPVCSIVKEYKKNKLELNMLNYISLKDIEFIEGMVKIMELYIKSLYKDYNYGEVVIGSISEIYSKIKEVGDYEGDLKVNCNIFKI